MKINEFRILSGSIAFFILCGVTATTSGQTRTIRVVTYNIEDDINGNTTPLPGLIAPSSGGSVTNGGVLEGIGEQTIGGDPAQPIDILALQETTSNATTVQPIVDGLNAFYSSRNIPAAYAMSPYQATQAGGNSNGNGPNAMVYNTNTLQLVASVGVGTPGGSSNGEYRQVVRYEFAPAGVTATTNNEFYVYVSHYKSGTNSTDLAARSKEAGIIRTNSASLPGNARVLYVGDYNVSTSGEASYLAIIGTALMGIPGIDRFNSTGSSNVDWTTVALLLYKTESAIFLHYRDDFQLMSSNVYYGVPGGLAYLSGSPGTYHTFGNDGSTAYKQSVNNGDNSSLDGNLTTNVTGITDVQLYQYLTTASDHLPVVADYTIPVPATSPVALFTANPTNGMAPLMVTFTDNSTGTITSNLWSFGDGGTTNFTAPTNVTYTYATAGVYTVTLIATGPGGSSTNTQLNLITVIDPFAAWQLQYFGCTNCPQAGASADPDGDGISNTNEFLTGTDPTNGVSALRITSMMQTNNDVLVTWTCGSGKTNTLQETSGAGNGSYQTNNFADIFTVTNTVGASTNYLDPGAATNFPSRYYRVRLVP